MAALRLVERRLITIRVHIFKNHALNAAKVSYQFRQIVQMLPAKDGASQVNNAPPNFRLNTVKAGITQAQRLDDAGQVRTLPSGRRSGRGGSWCRELARWIAGKADQGHWRSLTGSRLQRRTCACCLRILIRGLRRRTGYCGPPKNFL